MPPAVGWLSRSRVGYCDKTVDNSGCNAGASRGSWTLEEHEVVSWPMAAAACLARCRGCPQCAHISVSHQHRDCSWFEVCQQLHTDVAGFRSAPMIVRGDYVPQGSTGPDAELQQALDQDRLLQRQRQRMVRLQRRLEQTLEKQSRLLPQSVAERGDILLLLGVHSSPGRATERAFVRRTLNYEARAAPRHSSLYGRSRLNRRLLAASHVCQAGTSPLSPSVHLAPPVACALLLTQLSDPCNTPHACGAAPIASSSARGSSPAAALRQPRLLHCSLSRRSIQTLNYCRASWTEPRPTCPPRP